MTTTLAVLIVSGGMDSATLAYDARARGYGLHLVSFDYGQRHRKELGAARRIAAELDAPHDIVDLSDVGRRLVGSALTDPDVDVPEGHYAEDSMRATVVPNRNAIMLTAAYGIASAMRADLVGIGVHAGDHFVYPDCRPAFLAAFNEMQAVALEGFHEPRLWAPYDILTKAQIAERGAALHVPYELTWSCYQGGEVHCGRCGTCTERITALREAGVDDRTEYVDREYAFTLTAPC